MEALHEWLMRHATTVEILLHGHDAFKQYLVLIGRKSLGVRQTNTQGSNSIFRIPDGKLFNKKGSKRP